MVDQVRADAYRTFAKALKMGEVARPDACASCRGNDGRQLHAHHCDYTKPLAVTWLCEPCHFHWHSVYAPYPPTPAQSRLPDGRGMAPPVRPARPRLAKWLRGARREKRMTLMELGSAVGVEPSQVARWEAGKVRPSKRLLGALERALGVQFGEATDAR